LGEKISSNYLENEELVILPAADLMEKRVSKAESIVYRKIADECLLIPIHQNVADMESIYVLNEVGGRIWELIDGRRQLGEIRDFLVDEFEVSSQEAETDLTAFIDQLQEIGGVMVA
jgi:hypothetical protein